MEDQIETPIVILLLSIDFVYPAAVLPVDDALPHPARSPPTIVAQSAVLMSFFFSFIRFLLLPLSGNPRLLYIHVKACPVL